MASQASSIQTIKADFLDPSLYDDTGIQGLPRTSRGALFAAVSRAFDLAEGRRPGHAQRVAYVGVALARDLGMNDTDVEDVFLGCLLHDVGMAAMVPGPRVDTARGTKMLSEKHPVTEILGNMPAGGWSGVIEALAQHCDIGAKVAREFGLSEQVAHAVASHHDCWDDSAAKHSSEQAPMVARVVAIADRVESMIDGETSPLLVRRQGPRMVREMAGSELDPELAERMAVLAEHDEFWLGFYDNDLGTTLMTQSQGMPLEREELFQLGAVLSDIVDSRNGREVGRGRRVAELARKMAMACDMTDRRADLVKLAALLQDLGTLGVPAHFMSKPDILSIDEMAIVQMHPTHARDILSEVPGMGAAAWWVGCHHERIDGKGYPGMLEGDEVPIESQIIGMAEAYDALTNERPYRRALSHIGAIEVIRNLAGTRFQPYLLEILEGAV